MKPPKGYVTLGAAMTILGVSYRTIMRWIGERKMKTIKPGKEHFVALKEIQRIQEGN